MAHRKQHISKLLGSVKDLNYQWSEVYSELFEPNNKNLFKSHKVPKFKKRMAIN